MHNNVTKHIYTVSRTDSLVMESNNRLIMVFNVLEVTEKCIIISLESQDLCMTEMVVSGNPGFTRHVR